METKEIIVNTDQLSTWLENKENVVVLDVRPKDQREEWQIPGSIYIDAYKRLNENCTLLFSGRNNSALFFSANNFALDKWSA